MKKAAPAKPKPPFEVGTCISIALNDGTFGAGIITRKEMGSAPYNIFSILNYHKSSPAPAEFFENPEWLPAAAGSDLIVKYNLYTTNFLKSRNSYSIVQTISLDGIQVPQPMLLLGNWHNMREDLAKRLPPVTP